MSAVSIIIRAKNEASATFDRVKGDIKGFSEEGQKAMGGLKAANEAMSKAMRGDLVGAAHSAASAFKALWAVVMSNPLVAVAAAAAAVAVGLFKLWQANKKAEEAAREHAKEVAVLRNELDTLVGGSLAERVGEVAKALANDGDEMALRKRIQSIKDYKSELAGLADMQLADIGLMTDAKEIEKAKEQYKGLIDKIKELNDAQKQYEKALGDVKSEQEKTAAAEAAASAQAKKNLDERIAKERQLTLEIKEQFDEYELQSSKRAADGQADIEAFRKMVARRKELESATDDVTRAQIELKHITEDIEEMMSNPAGIDTLEYEKALESLRLKENEIAKLKEASKTITDTEGKNRLKDAQDLLAVEQAIGRAKKGDPWDNRAADPWDNRAADPWKNRPDPWDDLKWEDPGAGSPPKLGGGKGGLGGDEPVGQPPWQLTLTRIENELKGVRADLTGGGGGAA